MKSLLIKIIGVLTIGVMCISLCACNTTATNGENCESGHLFVDYSYTAPTCKTNGEKAQKCSRCGFIETETLLLIDHDYQTIASTPSSCSTHGSQTVKCSMCYNEVTIQLPLLNHNYELISETPSTCTIKGVKEYGCKDCSDSYSNELELLPHKFEIVDKATCFSYGKTVIECSYCNLIQDTIEDNHILQHSFGEDGYCTHCGIYKSWFNEDTINLNYEIGENALWLSSCYLIPKFKTSGIVIPDKYFTEISSIGVQVTCFDADGDIVDEFTGYTIGIPTGTMPAIAYNQADYSIKFYVSYRYAPNIHSFRIIFRVGYDSQPIEKTYNLPEA